MKNILTLLSLLILLTTNTYSQDCSHLYSTGSVMEVDRCASAWLIKRFVDEDAIFKFIPEGELIRNGIAFDTPDAELCRTHNLSTFEVILDQYRISDKRLDQLAENIHDIEINFWGNKQSRRSCEVKRVVNEIIKTSENNEECLSKCFQYFDRFLKKQTADSEK